MKRTTVLTTSGWIGTVVATGAFISMFSEHLGGFCPFFFVRHFASGEAEQWVYSLLVLIGSFLPAKERVWRRKECAGS